MMVFGGYLVFGYLGPTKEGIDVALSLNLGVFESGSLNGLGG